MPNRDTYTSGGAYINFVAALEMALRNGKMKKYGDIQLGLETGDPLGFACWEDLWEAYKAQHIHFLRAAFIQQYNIINIRRETFAQPMGSAIHDLCMEHCMDLHQQNRIPGGINLGYFEYIGLGTVVDSLAAMKKLVFEDKKLTMKQILDAMEANFVGYEDVEALLRSAPCFGNNDPYADSIGKAIDELSVKYANKYNASLGTTTTCATCPSPLTCPSGRSVARLPTAAGSTRRCPTVPRPPTART